MNTKSTNATPSVPAPEVPFYEKPCAAAGLISYRYAYKGGWVMIGAVDDRDALSEASRSVAASHKVDVENLQVWNGTAYKPVSAPAEDQSPKNELLKNGGWTFQGSRSDIVLAGEYMGVQYQVTRESTQTGPHSGPVQFRQVFAGHTLRTDSGLRESCQLKSKASKRDMQAEAESMIKHSATWEDKTIPLSVWAAMQEYAPASPSWLPLVPPAGVTGQSVAPSPAEPVKVLGGESKSLLREIADLPMDRAISKLVGLDRSVYWDLCHSVGIDPETHASERQVWEASQDCCCSSHAANLSTIAALAQALSGFIRYTTGTKDTALQMLSREGLAALSLVSSMESK